MDNPKFLSPHDYFRLQQSRPRKRFGQNFLTQPPTAERIVRSAELTGAEVAVEIGPGLGALTQFILPQVRALHLVELDRDLAAYLQTSLEDSRDRVTIHSQDVLTFDFTAVSRAAGERVVVLGNLPYNISSPLIFHLLDSIHAVKRAVFMVQKEVGERFAAASGSKEYGVLSVLLGVAASVTPLFTVGPRQFYPPPQVDSLVLRIDFPEPAPGDRERLAALRRVVNTAFQQRRKTLLNSLKGLFGLSGAELAALLAELEIDSKRRPETLSPQEFLLLSQRLQAARS